MVERWVYEMRQNPKVFETAIHHLVPVTRHATRLSGMQVRIVAERVGGNAVGRDWVQDLEFCLRVLHATLIEEIWGRQTPPTDRSTMGS